MTKRRGRAAVVFVGLAALQRGTPLLLLPVMAAALTPSEYGAASTLVATSLLLTTVLAAPLEQLIFRLRTRVGAESTSRLAAVRIYVLWILTPVLCVAGGFISLTPGEIFGIGSLAWGIEIAAVAFLAVVTYFALPVVQSTYELRGYFAIAATAVTSLVLTKIGFVFTLGWGVVGWAISDLVSNFVAAVVGVGVARLPKAQVHRHDFRYVASFCIPLIPHRASFWAISSLSRPALAAVSNLAQVGLVAVGLNLGSVANLVLAEVNRAFLPSYSNERLPAPTSRTRTTGSVQVVLAFAVPALVASSVAIAGPVFFPSSYWPAFPLVGIVLLGQTAYGLYLIPMNYLIQTAGHTRLSWLASLPSAILILGATLWFGAVFGAIVVSWATTAGMFLMLIAAFVLLKAHGVGIDWNRLVPAPVELVSSFFALIFGFVATQASAERFLACSLAAASIAFVGFVAFRRFRAPGGNSRQL